MALFFNSDVLDELAGDDPNKYLALLEYKYSGNVAPHRKSKYKPATKSLSGNSFLLNPEPLFRDKNTDILYIVQYIKLAARRDFALYKFHNFTGLQLSYYPNIDLESVKHNPLLTVTNQQINFKYER